MSKQSLVEFQVKLMERLNSADSSDDIASWLAVNVAGHRYLIPLAEAGEVISLNSVAIQIEKVAHTKNWFLGIFNLRGAPYAAVDFAAWLGLRPANRNMKQLSAQEAVMIIFNQSLGLSCALLLDKILGLRSDHEWTKTDIPDNADPQGEYVKDKEGKVWQIISLADLARDEYFLAVESE